MKRIALLAALIGCSTPYQSRGFRGGYKNEQLGPGRFAIESKVNSFTSKTKALEYAHRRAGELCPSGYDVVDSADGQRDFYIRNGDTVQNHPKSEVGLIVECK